MSKTPTYVKNAVSRYQKKTVRKVLSLNTENQSDLDLINYIASDDMSFNARVKKVLLKYYQEKNDE